MHCDELIAKAATHARQITGNYRIVGDPVFRETASVYFQCDCEGELARVEVIIDRESGKCLGAPSFPELPLPRPMSFTNSNHADRGR